MAKRETKDEGDNALPELEAGFTDIKNFFKAGAVPREADYAKLIEYVHYLHKLLGVEGEEEGHEPTLGHGLTTSDDGVLCVDAQALVGAPLTTDDNNKLTLDASAAAGYGLSGDGSKLAFNPAAVAQEGSGLEGDNVVLKFNAEEVAQAGSGLKGEGITLKFNAQEVAGSGLIADTTNDIKLNVDTGALRLSTVNWFYQQMALYKATHFALAPIESGGVVPKVSEAHFILFFTRANDNYVRVRGFATGPNIFDYAPLVVNWEWGGQIPQVNVGRVYADNFSLLYSDTGSISGTINIKIAFKIGDNFFASERSCVVTELKADTIIN